uniref:Protein kinase domain-containing protein n=1 Tax=Meloidogyne javanica TaxID=6303 RepID=A0A915N4S2_MELJA
MFASIGDVCDRPIHNGRRSTVYISKQESECFALKASSEYAWKKEMEVYRTLQSVPGNKFTRIQELLGSGELPVFFKSHNSLHKFYILTRYNNLRDVKMWLTNIPGLSEAMRFKAARETLLALKELHQLGFVSRDVKLENFGVHITKDHRLKFYIYDFELSQKYKDVETGKPTVQKIRGSKGHGTTESAPLVQMTGSRRTFPVDDVEGWFYCLYHILCDSIPWDIGWPQPEFRESTYATAVSGIRYTKQQMHETGRIYCAKEYDCLMSAIFNVILKWSKTPEVVEARFYDEICSILKKGVHNCGKTELMDCNIHCMKHYKKHQRHDA